MTITVRGPDGSNFLFPDNTPENEVKSALDQHYGGAAALVAPEQDVSALAAGRGIPLLGAFSDKAAAALRTAVRGGTMAGNEAQIKGAINAYEAAHPVESAVGKLAMGTVATAPLGAIGPVARGLGMAGPLKQAVPAAIASGAGIGAADEALRGGDPYDIAKSAVVNAGVGGALPMVGRGVGMAARGVRNLVAPLPRTPHTVDLNGNTIPVSESYVNPTNEVGSQEQAALSGALNPQSQEIAQGALEATHAATGAAAEDFGNQMRGGPGPSQPQATKPVAAGQVITELAQQHNDQITAAARQEAQQAVEDARHGAQISAEGASIRSNIAAPLGTPEVPRTAGESLTNVQTALQEAEAASRANYGNLYQTASQLPGVYHPAAFSGPGDIGASVRNQITRGAQARGERPAIVNQQLTPNAQAALDLLDNELGQGFVQNSIQRGTMVRLPDGRYVPRPITPVDVESIRKQLVGLLQDARNVQARGGSGNDAYAMQLIMDAFNQHHNAILGIPGAFTGDGAAYRQAIDNARAAFAQHRETFTNQRRGDNVGPTIERIIGGVGPGNAEPMPIQPMAQAVYGSPSAPGGGNSPLIVARLRDILGANSPAFQDLRQGMISHIIENPEGMEPMAPGKQADRLAQYAGTQHARELFTPQERTRMMAHANDLRAQANPPPPPPPPPPPTAVQRQVEKLATEGTSLEVVKKIFSASGDVTPGADKLLTELKGRVSQQIFNSLREAMWNHLIEKPEGMVNWGPRELSNRLSRFLSNPAAEVLYSPSELGIMREFQKHWAKMAPLPNTTNPSGSAVMASKLMQQYGNLIGARLGGMVGGAVGGIPGAAIGAAVGHGARHLTGIARTAQQVERTRELFLGKKGSYPLNRNIERAAAVLSHAATPLIDQNGP